MRVFIAGPECRATSLKGLQGAAGTTTTNPAAPVDETGSNPQRVGFCTDETRVPDCHERAKQTIALPHSSGPPRNSPGAFVTPTHPQPRVPWRG